MMLTPEQLETLKRLWREAKGADRRRYWNEAVPALFRHIDELQAALEMEQAR